MRTRCREISISFYGTLQFVSRNIRRSRYTRRYTRSRSPRVGRFHLLRGSQLDLGYSWGHIDECKLVYVNGDTVSRRGLIRANR